MWFFKFVSFYKLFFNTKQNFNTYYINLYHISLQFNLNLIQSNLNPINLIQFMILNLIQSNLNPVNLIQFTILNSIQIACNVIQYFHLNRT